MQQITNTVLMVRPASFGMNEQTISNNFFQKELVGVLPNTIKVQALREFDLFVDKLKSVGVGVIVVEDTKQPVTPDAIFPNNWISFHEDGSVVIYPMFAENRREERREDILDFVESHGFRINDVVDYSSAEDEGLFLEGTGSLVLDRVNKKAYCALSERTDEDLVIEFCEDFEYTPILFTAYQTINNQKEVIYHTNVMMSLAQDFAVVCLQAISDKKERKQLVKQLKEDGKEIISISESQLAQFAGNMLQVMGDDKMSYLVMSTTAEESLTNAQRSVIEKHCTILSSSLDTIESCGGGSTRCMMAEILLPKF